MLLKTGVNAYRHRDEAGVTLGTGERGFEGWPGAWGSLAMLAPRRVELHQDTGVGIHHLGMPVLLRDVFRVAVPKHTFIRDRHPQRLLHLEVHLPRFLRGQMATEKNNE